MQLGEHPSGERAVWLTQRQFIEHAQRKDSCCTVPELNALWKWLAMNSAPRVWEMSDNGTLQLLLTMEQLRIAVWTKGPSKRDEDEARAQRYEAHRECAEAEEDEDDLAPKDTEFQTVSYREMKQATNRRARKGTKGGRKARKGTKGKQCTACRRRMC